MARRSDWSWTSFLLGLAAGAGLAAYGIKNAAAHTTVGLGDWRTLSSRRWTGLRTMPPPYPRPYGLQAHDGCGPRGCP